MGWGWRNGACSAWRREGWCGRRAGAFSYPSREASWRRQRQPALRCLQGKDRKQKPQLAVRESPAEHRKRLLAPPSLESCKTQLGSWANTSNLERRLLFRWRLYYVTSRAPFWPTFCRVAWGVSATSFQTKAAVERAQTTASCPRSHTLKKSLDCKKAPIALQWAWMRTCQHWAPVKYNFVM